MAKKLKPFHETSIQVAFLKSKQSAFSPHIVYLWNMKVMSGVQAAIGVLKLQAKNYAGAEAPAPGSLRLETSWQLWIVGF